MKKLIELRKKRKLSQQEMADIIGITQQAYSHYENGRREPDYKTLIEIADFFETTIDFLLEKTDDPVPPGANPNLKCSDLDISFYEGVDLLTDDEKKEILGYINFKVSERTKAKETGDIKKIN